MNSTSLATTSSELPNLQQQQQQQQNKHHVSKKLSKKQSSLQRSLTSLLRKSGSNNSLSNTVSTQQHKKDINNNSSSSPEESVLSMAPASTPATTAAALLPEAATPATTSTASTAASFSRSTVSTLPTTFVTLVDQDNADDDGNDDDDDDASTSNSNSSSTGNTGPYLATPHIVGQRSLSTPNLHTDGPSLLASPINSPPGSPGLTAMATVVETEVPSLHLDEAAAVAAASNGNTPLILTLSPVGSPENSPKLTPRSSGLTLSMTGFSLNGSSQRPAPGSQARPARPNTGSVGVGMGMNGSNNNNNNGVNNKAAMPPPPPMSADGASKTLRSSKKKTVNRNSVVSLFDTGSSSMTLPTNFARKGSLPQDANGQSNAKGLTSLFNATQQDMTTPFSLTLAEFRLNDLYPRRQRRLLTVLHRLDYRLKEEGIVKRLTKEQLKGKPVILHNIEMAIRDRKPELALQYISLLPSNALKKKKKKAHNDLNHCMLLAMIYRMEKVAVELVERGFPVDVNAPIVARGRKEQLNRPGRPGPFQYPSYFLVAVGLGMYNLVRAMIKNANLNQSWCGLTPLLLATTLNECTNATCPPPTLSPAKLASLMARGESLKLDIGSQSLINQLPSSFNRANETQYNIPGYTPTSPNSIVSLLLDFGADPNQGITLQQYLWASKLKGMGVLNRRRKAQADFEAAGGEKNANNNPIEYYIAKRRHESGRQWLSHSEIKAKKAARALLANSELGNKRHPFSPEMQNYWQGKSILPVELAIASGNIDCARTILQRLGPQSLKNSSFGLLLQNDVMLTLSLIKSGCPVNQHDLHGCTPLHLAARRGHLEMAMVLLQLGGDVNSKGERQWTPLHESISQNHANISSLLIACGADLTARNDAGETPEDLGKRRGLSPEVLKNHLDPSKAKACSAGLVHSFSPAVTEEVNNVSGTRSGNVSRRTSYEHLGSQMRNSLRSSMTNTLVERSSGGQDTPRSSFQFGSSKTSSLSSSREQNDGSQSTGGDGVDAMNIHRLHLQHRHQDSIGSTNSSEFSLGNGSNGSLSGGGHKGGTGGHSASASQSSLNSLASNNSSAISLTGSLNGSDKKKKKVRGFLKSIFNSN
ncbi:hypothetical protein BGW42_005626 [Actinomortierella wolfii]|nr:hypothetical protein BGW42_005626 [Actinomortierella wolfii]